MIEYQCWFCDEGISRADPGAVLVTIGGLWRWDAGSTDEDSPLQSVYAHSNCARTALKGATMDIEPHIFGESED